MADSDDLTEGARFQSQVTARPQVNQLKGAGALDWGMQSRLARVFNPATNRTVMLAIDHGYFQGPTTGLERVDLSIVPLLGFADALMTTRGMVRSTIPPTSGVPIVLRASGGPSILKELSDEQVAVAMDDAVRLNAAAVAVQVFIGGENETQSVHNMTRLVDEGQRAGMSGARGHRGRPGAHPGRALPAARGPDLRRTRRSRGEDVLLRRRTSTP